MHLWFQLSQLPARGEDIVAAGGANVSDDGAVAEDAEEPVDPLPLRALVNTAADAGARPVVGDQIDVGAKPAHQVSQQVRLLVRIVDAGKHAVFDIHDAPSSRLIAPGGFHDLCNRI